MLQASGSARFLTPLMMFRAWLTPVTLAAKRPAESRREGEVTVSFENWLTEVELTLAEELLKSPAMITGFLIPLM